MPEDETPPDGTGIGDESWPVDSREDADTEMLGLSQTGRVVWLYDRDSGSVLGGRPDAENERIVTDPDSERALGPGESLGQVIEELGDDLGWESLSEFAREHLEKDERG